MSQEHSAPFSSNLSHRLIIIFLILTLAVYAAGLTVTLKLRSNAVQDSQAAYLAQAEMFSDQLNNELTRISTQMKYTLTRSVTLWLSLAPNNTSFPQLYEFVLRMTDQIYSLQNTSSLIESTSVYFSELDKCIHSSGTYNTPTDTERLLIDSYYEMPAHSAVLAVDGQLYLVSDAFTFNSKAATSLVWARLSNKLLSQLCGQYTEDGQPAVLYCIGDSGSYLAIGGNSEFPSAAILEDIQTAAAEGKSGMVSATVDGTPCLRALQPVGAWNLWVARYASSRAPREVTEPFTVWIVVQTAITLLAAGSFVFLVWRLITRPFRRIMQQLQELEHTGFPLADANSSKDMDFLHRAFVQLGAELQNTLEQAYYSKELAYQSEIKYLQAQINPHFLYNSFYHLYRMAKMEDTEGVAEMSMKLSAYYRYITRSAQTVVPLSMEYQNIVDYTEIQTIRFGERIAVELQPLPEAYRELNVPRFILQPMFENAYNHGVEKMENGHIQLRFESEADALNIYVENDGTCPDAELETLTRYLNSTDRHAECTALKNVQRRIQLLGGTLEVSHGTLGGFGVRLRIPLHPVHPQNPDAPAGLSRSKEERNHANTVDC